MALFSLVAEHEQKSFSTQVKATSAAEAVSEFFTRIYPKTASAFGTKPPRLTAQDVIYVTPMEGWSTCGLLVLAPRVATFPSSACAHRLAMWSNSSIQRTSQRPLCALCAAAHVKR